MFIAYMVILYVRDRYMVKPKQNSEGVAENNVGAKSLDADEFASEFDTPNVNVESPKVGNLDEFDEFGDEGEFGDLADIDDSTRQAAGESADSSVSFDAGTKFGKSNLMVQFCTS